MFQDVGSKVAEEVKLFKTYHPYKKIKKVDDGVDHLINKVQAEINENNKQNFEQPMNPNYNVNNPNEVQVQPQPVPQ